jgi:hypothetical protein
MNPAAQKTAPRYGSMTKKTQKNLIAPLYLKRGPDAGNSNNDF